MIREWHRTSSEPQTALHRCEQNGTKRYASRTNYCVFPSPRQRRDNLPLKTKTRRVVQQLRISAGVCVHVRASPPPPHHFLDS